MTRAVRARDLAFMVAASAVSRVCRVLYLIDERLGFSERYERRERRRLARQKARRRW